MNKKHIRKVLVAACIIALLCTGIGTWFLIANKSQGSVISEKPPQPQKASDLKIATSDYKISEDRLELRTDAATPDLENSVSTDASNRQVVWFTLSSFVQKADAAGYSYTDPSGVNSCTRLVSVELFANVGDARNGSNGVSGDLVDASGNPTNQDTVRLADGRYAYIGRAQALCNSNSSFDGSTLQTENSDAISAIRGVLYNSLQSY